MNSIEETLWDYIDGSCTLVEQEAITSLIASDESVRLKYQELLNLNKEFSAMEFDEPAMAFTYNVMETIRAEHAQTPLKAAVNKYIILGIAIFFVFTILALLIYTISGLNFSVGSIIVKSPGGIKIPEMSRLIPKQLILGFFFFDIVLALFLSDAFLRNKKHQHGNK